MPPLACGAATDIGRVRKMNQDSMAVLAAGDLDGSADGLYVVADGMGGRAGGEIASRVTVQTVPDVVREALESGDDGEEALAQALSEGIVAANRAVWMQARANPELRGMGTTCVAVLIRGGVAAIGNVGDSRIYLLRGGALRQITSDHSLVQEHVLAGDLTAAEARSSRYRNVITRAIGITDDVSPDVDLLALRSGDTLLLCSDGLTNMVGDQEIAAVLSGVADPKQAAESLVAVANANGGVDNITAVVVRYGDFTPIHLPPAEEPELNGAGRDQYEPPPPPHGPRVAWFLPLLLLIVGLTGLALWIVNRAPAPRTNNSPGPSTAPPRPGPAQTVTYAPPVAIPTEPLRGAPLACDPDGNVYALSRDGRILHVSPRGTTSGDFGAPTKVKDPAVDQHWAVDSQGNLYIAYHSAKRIDKFKPSGTRIATLTAPGKLKGPDGIAVDRQGNIYIVDGGVLKVLRVRVGPRQPEEADHGAR